MGYKNFNAETRRRGVNPLFSPDFVARREPKWGRRFRLPTLITVCTRTTQWNRPPGLLGWAFAPRNFMKKWGSLDVAGRAGQHRKPAEAGCGQNWPPHSVGAFSTLSFRPYRAPQQKAGEKSGLDHGWVTALTDVPPLTGAECRNSRQDCQPARLSRPC